MSRRLLWIICWIYGASASSTHAFEAIFQGSCKKDSSCEQRCVFVDAETFKCGCEDGFRLLKDGISCQNWETSGKVRITYEEAGTPHPRLHTLNSAPRPEGKEAATVALDEDGKGSTVGTHSFAHTHPYTYQPIHFGGDSYLGFDVPRDMYLETRVEVEFRVEREGVVFFAGQDYGRDFISLAVHNHHLTLRLDCGEGVVEEEYEGPFQSGVWHSVLFSREQCTHSQMTVDHAHTLHATHQDMVHYKGISVSKEVYLGGVPEKLRKSVEKKTGVTSLFQGCIRTLRINAHTLLHTPTRIHTATHSHNTGVCEEEEVVGGAEVASTPCSLLHCPSNHPCLLHNFLPICAPPPSLHTDDSISTSVHQKKTRGKPFFSGGSFAKFKAPSDLSRYLDLGFHFNATQHNGVLFYASTHNREQFVLIYLKNAFLFYHFDIGSGAALLRSERKVEMGVFEGAEVWRTGKGGLLKLRGEDWVEGSAPHFPPKHLGQWGWVYVGGVPAHTLPPHIFQGKETGFHGCITKIRLNGKRLKVWNAEEVVGVGKCGSNPCLPNPCGVEECSVVHDNFLCLCPHPKTGDTCLRTLPSSTSHAPLSFKGHGYLEFAQDPIMERVMGDKLDLSMTFRMKRREGVGGGQQVLVWTGKETVGGDYLHLAVTRHGHLILRMNLGSGPVRIIHRHSNPTDGKWHTARVKRAGRKVTLIVDGHVPMTTVAPAGSVQLNVYESLFIGGYHPKHGVFPDSGLQGCISQVVLDGTLRIDSVQQATSAINVQQCT